MNICSLLVHFLLAKVLLMAESDVMSIEPLLDYFGEEAPLIRRVPAFVPVESTLSNEKCSRY